MPVKKVHEAALKALNLSIDDNEYDMPGTKLLSFGGVSDAANYTVVATLDAGPFRLLSHETIRAARGCVSKAAREEPAPLVG